MPLALLKFFTSSVLALIVALGLFTLMQGLVGNAQPTRPEIEDFSGVDFVRLKREEPLKVKEREIPEEPPPPDEPPPPPKLEVANQEQPQREMPDIDIPNINMPSITGTGANIANYGFQNAATTGDRGLIPRVQFPPSYPREALIEGMEGFVRFTLTIDAQGNVIEADVIEFSDRVFIRDARRAIFRWKFVPKVEDGQPVETTGTWEISFSLND